MITRTERALGRRAAAILLAAAAVWRMPYALGLAPDSKALAAHAVSITLVIGLALLLQRAFACGERRLWGCAGGVGLTFALFLRVGEPLRRSGAFAPFTWPGLLGALLDVAVYAVVAASTVLLLYQAVLRYARREANGKESLYSRLLGNGFLVFVLLLAGWLPVWLAFYPGTFAADSVTQFYEVLNEDFSPHHPLLHTLLLGNCIQLGIDLHPEGSATPGVAIYSLVQMVLLAGLLAYACRWMRRRRAPVWARTCVTLVFMLFPFHALWSFYGQKDVLFGGLALVFVLMLTDLWQEGFAGLRKPLRVAAFVVIAVLMMLMRNNGVYALALTLPLAVALAKGARVRMGVLLAACAALYLAANGCLIAALDATGSDAAVEMLSIPLQQLARTAKLEGESLPAEVTEALDTLYPEGGIAAAYTPSIADPVKWAMDEDALEVGSLLTMWARVGVSHMDTYAEAFLIQNLPYFLPGADMLYRFDLGVQPLDWFELEAHSYLPRLKACYEEYDRTLTLFGLPGVRLLSDTAFQVWLCIGALGLAIYRRQRGWVAAMGFLLALWITCLLGPVAIIRYMLTLFYAMPVALAAMLAPAREGD